MLPIVTPDEMRAIDAAAPEPPDVLIERAGWAVARAATRMLGGTYGRTVHVIVGHGNNGADGRVAARLLSARGAAVQVHSVDELPDVLDTADLVIDAAFGTGFHGTWRPPDIGDSPVLAVDIPSGIDARTGAAGGGVLPADRTVTFAAFKPGHLFPPGCDLIGEIEVADIGLDVGFEDGIVSAHLLEPDDVAAWLPWRSSNAHKWGAAVRVIAGSPTMQGAAALAAAGAQRAGAGIVHVSMPGVADAGRLPLEAVLRPLPPAGWAGEALRTFDRFHALVLGPGLGRNDDTAASTRHVAVNSPLPVVIDGDGLFALAWNADGAAALLRRREAPTVLTPHDGEFEMLTGTRPGPDRIAAARRLAADAQCVVLLKGPATVVAHPDGQVLVVTSGDERLATAGTGDVLAGIIGAFMAMKIEPFEAAAMAAWVHGRAAMQGSAVGFVAGDLPALVPAVLVELRERQ
jgi:ADP-dependent NAD(P)H-hydrate dehydratase / NAD(P)H-hydrate epimerase